MPALQAKGNANRKMLKTKQRSEKPVPKGLDSGLLAKLMPCYRNNPD